MLAASDRHNLLSSRGGDGEVVDEGAHVVAEVVVVAVDPGGPVTDTRTTR